MVKAQPINVRYVPFWHIDANKNTVQAYRLWRSFLYEIIDDVDFALISRLEYSITGIIITFNAITPRISKYQYRIRDAYLRLYSQILESIGPPDFQYEIPLKIG